MEKLVHKQQRQTFFCKTVEQRGSQAFMPSDISMAGEMLESSCIDGLKAIGVWTLLMSFFVVLNPDKRFPFHLNIK